jgi:multiple sugar transport system permease protein
MDSIVATGKPMSKASAAPVGLRARWLVGRRGRKVREAALAYAFLLPAILIIGTFGLFPLIFAAYESTLRGLNKIVGDYDGLNNYVKAIGNLTYVLGFWLAVAALFFATRLAIQTIQAARSKGQAWLPWLLPGMLNGAGLALFLIFVFRFLPALLLIPNKLRGQNNTSALFRQMVGEAWWSGPVQQSFWLFVGLIGLGLLLGYWVEQRQKARDQYEIYLDELMAVSFLIIVALGIGWLTWSEVRNAYATALAAGEGLDLWSQIITISAGFLLLLLAWWLWESASDRASNRSTVLRLGGAALLMVGAWLLIGELPRAGAGGDKNWWIGLQATVYYSIGTVPTQLAISLLLAVLLFQDIRGKSFFRLVYFIPYVAPFVGTAAVFRILFSYSPDKPVNLLLSWVGVAPLKWLNEPTGLFQLLVGNGAKLPDWAVGPSLALVVIMVYGVWTFIGFNTVVFMAGLGSIPREVYEAASMDGAGRWAQFRHITLPLLSPTIYFLTLYSVIGTFKAFNHLYVLRSAAALGTTDTASIVIFQAFKRDTRYGYASALAILLLIIILILTVVNNRIASRRVFYG